MTWIRILISLFVLFALGRLAQNFRGRTMSRVSVLVWSLLWIGVAVIFWLPETASRVALLAGIGRGADLVVYLSIIIIFYVLFRLFVRIEHLNRDITAISRAIALDHDRKKNNSSDSHPKL